MSRSVKEIFGNKVRIRVCGLLFENNKILLVKHQLDDYQLWSPPGGGVEFGETTEQTLVREFKEEVKLDITVMEFLFFTEHIKPPLHAIELFYKVEVEKMDPRLGIEPELPKKNILIDFKFMGKNELAKVPGNDLHVILKSCTNPIELLDKRGQVK